MSQPTTSSEVSTARTVEYSLGQLIAYALKLGSLGFGRPVALVGYMHRDLVERRNWISEADYKDGLALAQLAPGPLAAQLAIYLGYVRYFIKSEAKRSGKYRHYSILRFEIFCLVGACLYVNQL